MSTENREVTKYLIDIAQYFIVINFHNVFEGLMTDGPFNNDLRHLLTFSMP